jgi:hypothetical protein
MEAIHDKPFRSVYKKIDSVLRGHAGMESELLASALGRDSLMVAAGNPSRGRTVVDGGIRVDGIPLEESLFRNDPLYPAVVSDVLVLWKNSGAEGNVKAELEGEVSRESLPGIAARVSNGQLAVGALEFFTALLEREFTAKAVSTIDLTSERSIWIVCGSSAGWSERERLFRSRSWPVRIDNSVSATGPVLIGCGNGNARTLAESVKLLAEEFPPSLWCLEGGATASSVMEEMGWSNFEIIGEIAPGTACLLPAGADFRVLVKPGSYDWPPAVIDALERSGKESG